MTHAAADFQLADAVLMIRPAAFTSNPETAATNRFQTAELGQRGDLEPRQAIIEFDRLANALQRSGVTVHALADVPLPAKPDACFPNNWVSFHHDGTVVLYPMLAPNRRLERRLDVLDRLVEQGYQISRKVDLSHWEERGAYLEGTGSLVLDHGARLAFAALSSRTCAEPLEEFAVSLGYEAVPFDAVDAAGVPVYHTNVVMSLGMGFAVICLESIRDLGQRRTVESRIAATGRQIVYIDPSQMARFAANLLMLRTASGQPVIAISSTARRALREAQVAILERYGELVVVDVETIERFGGGSVRCMLAEVFLPRS